jgi:SAM-dependent methyltransferase
MNRELNGENACLTVDDDYWERRQSCPLCGHVVFRRVVDARDRHYGNPGTFPVVECELCGLWFLNPMPTIKYLEGAYPADYYSYSTPDADHRNSGLKKLKNSIRKVIGFTSGWTGDPKMKSPGRVLDVGCGAGDFLLQMRDKGWEVHGVELSADAAQRGREKGLDIFGGTIETARYPEGAFDYVRSNHSFEHIHNPREVLHEIHRIIKPSGLLFIGVPNVSGLMSRVFGTYWWYLGAPVHTFGYNPGTLTKLLAQEGFRVTRVQYNSTHAGIFGSLQIFLNRNNGRSSEQGWVSKNFILQLIGHWVARCTDILHAGDCIELIAEPVYSSQVGQERQIDRETL